MASKGIALFVIPIIFSFVYGGLVLGSVMQGPRADSMTTHYSALEILELQGSYASGERVSVQISVNDASYDCGDIYITVYDVAGGAKKAVKQGAFLISAMAHLEHCQSLKSFQKTLMQGNIRLKHNYLIKLGTSF